MADNDTGGGVVELPGGWTLGRKPLGTDKAVWTHALLHPNGVTFSRIGDDEAAMLRDLAARLAAAEAQLADADGALANLIANNTALAGYLDQKNERIAELEKLLGRSPTRTGQQP